MMEASEFPPEGFEMIPPEEADPEAETAALDAAEASALPEPDEALLPEDPVEPLGRTWLFNFETGRFVRSGQAPAGVSGVGALKVWILMAIHTARGAHAVFTDAFGIEDPNLMIGAVDGASLVDEYGAQIREALLVHDRISDVEEYVAEYYPDQGVMYIENLTILTDEEETLRFEGVPVTTIPGGAA